MRKTLLSIVLAVSCTATVFGSTSDPIGELAAIFAENFDAFINGTEKCPSETELSVGGKVDPSLTGGFEWQGKALHEAGGVLAITHFEQTDWFGTETVQGYVRTPYVDVRMDGGRFMLRFKARALSEEAADIHVEVYDPYTTNSVDAGKVEINDSWTTYEVSLSHPGYGNHLAFIEMASEGEDWLLDDVEIIQDYYALSSPIVHFARNVSYEEFTGRWNPVPFAKEYLVSAYSLDDKGDRVYIVEDAKTQECSMTVYGTQKGTDYFYIVKSINDKYISAASEPRQVHVPLNTLETPVALEAENVTKDGFTARWEPTFRAMGYIVRLKKQFTVTEDRTVTILTEDFDKIKAGTTAWPEIFYGNLDDYSSMPGWDYNYFTSRTAMGMFGLDISYKHYGEPCYLSTPTLDLSGADGKFTVTMTVYGGKDNVVSLTCNGKTMTHTLEAQGRQEFSVEFDNGTDTSIIRIEMDGNSPYTTLLIDSIKIEQSVKSGDKVTENISNERTETPATSLEITGLNGKEGDTFVYTVKAWSYSLDEDGVWGPDIFSAASAPQEVFIKAEDNAVEGICEEDPVLVSVSGDKLDIYSRASTEAEIYRADGGLVGRYRIEAGHNLIEPSIDGVLIVKVGNKAIRVMVR